jgi:WD40 repeat protein/serine/threonine protein kinase
MTIVPHQQSSHANRWAYASGSAMFFFKGQLSRTLFDDPLPSSSAVDVGSTPTFRIMATQGAVRSVVFSPNGALLAAACGNSITRIWRVKTGECIMSVSGHTSAVNSVAFSSQGALLATGGDDSMVLLSSVLNGGARVATLSGHDGAVLAVAFSPDGTLIATASVDTTTKLWRIADGVCVATICGHISTVTSVAFSPDATFLATGSLDTNVKLWSLRNGDCHTTLSGMGAVRAVAFCPDGVVIAGGGEGGQTALWRVLDGKRMNVVGKYDASVSVFSVSFSFDGVMFATGLSDGTTHLWRVRNSAHITTINSPCAAVSSVAFSPDRQWIAVGSRDETASLWRITDGSVYLGSEGDAHRKLVTAVAFSPDGSMVASASLDGTAKLWRVEDAVCIWTYEGHTDGVCALAFSPDGKLLATGSSDTTIVLWNVLADGATSSAAAATVRGHKSTVTTIAFSQDGHTFITGSSDRTVKIWSVADNSGTVTTSLVTSLTNLATSVTSVALTCGGTIAATGCRDKTVRLWYVKTKVCIVAQVLTYVPVQMSIRQDGCAVHVQCFGVRPAEEFTQLAVQVDLDESRYEAFPCAEYSNRNAMSSSALASASRFLTPTSPRQPTFPRIPLSALEMDRDVFASGSTCNVFRTTYQNSSWVAKIYHRHVIRAIEQEICVVPFLQHPHIVRVSALLFDDAKVPASIVGLLMEPCDGGSLDCELKKLAGTPSSTYTRLKWMHEVSLAVLFVHSMSVVHGDIKPSNVLLRVDDNNKIAKLTDFGSSHVLETFGTSSSSDVGTPLFVAPEYASGETGPTRALDVFSFGVTLWCTMYHPLEHGLGRTAIQIARSIDLGKRPAIPADNVVPSDVTDLIEACWCHDASRRPTMGLVEETLRRISTVLVTTQGKGFPVGIEALVCMFKDTIAKSLRPALSSLQWTECNNGFMFSNSIAERDNPCMQFVCAHSGSAICNVSIKRVEMISHTSSIEPFRALHDAESQTRMKNPVLRPEARHLPLDLDSLAALQYLAENCFVDAPREQLGATRILLCWHGTASSRASVERLCQEGPHNGSGPFGSGCYFSLEADYAARSSCRQIEGAAAVLFAVSVSDVYVVTPSRDYRLQPQKGSAIRSPNLHGFSNFYCTNRSDEVALAPRYDAHFIPVKDYGHTHPLTGQQVQHDVGFQAVSRRGDQAEAHELVVRSFHRCMPLAVAFF